MPIELLVCGTISHSKSSLHWSVIHSLTFWSWSGNVCCFLFQFKIQYIDYGNTEEIALSGLVEIPQNIASIKGLAQKIVLHNILAKDLSDKQVINAS